MISTPDTGADVKPQLVSDLQGSWLAVWSSSENLNGTAGTDFDLLFSRSEDGGNTWSAPQLLNLNGNGDGDGDFDPEVATDGKGHWTSVWFSNDLLISGNSIGDDDDILVTHSYDNGATWSAEVPLNSNAATDSAEADDFTPRLAADGQGNWVVAWHSEGMTNALGADHDIFLTRSSDDGTNWSPVAILNSNAADDTGDDDFVTVRVDERGRWIAGWSSSEPALGGHNMAYSTSFDVGRSRIA